MNENKNKMEKESNSTKLKLHKRSSSMKIKSLDALYCVTILNDCIDQLAILGHIMSDTFEGGTTQAKQIVVDVTEEALGRQYKAEENYKAALARKLQLKSDKYCYNSAQVDNGKFQEAARELGRTTLEFKQTLEWNPLTSENLTKINADRSFVQEIMENVVSTLITDLTFTPLVHSVATTRREKQGIQETIEKERHSQSRVKELTKLLADVTEEKAREIQNLNEMIAHLKDQIQEMKAKSGMENKYVEKCAKLNMAQTQKICQLKENRVRNEVDDVEVKTDLETRINAEIVQFLGKTQMLLDEKLEFWMTKYEKDVEDKQKQLDDLKTAKNTDWKRLVDLTRKYKEYEEVVVEDRIQKEILRRKAEEEELYIKASIKVQSWWRGIMVRKGYGMYQKKKKKKKTKKAKGTKQHV
ncbi:dynein regulatory complex protein 9-like [Argonauta hians]